MNRTVLLVIAVLALTASIGMKVMAKDSHLTELADYWWIPLPLALICLIVANAPKKQ